MRFTTLLLSLSLALAACSDGDAAAAADASIDPRADAGADASPADAGPDADPDVVLADASPDASADARPDADPVPPPLPDASPPGEDPGVQPPPSNGNNSTHLEGVHWGLAQVDNELLRKAVPFEATGQLDGLVLGPAFVARRGTDTDSVMVFIGIQNATATRRCLVHGNDLDVVDAHGAVLGSDDFLMVLGSASATSSSCLGAGERSYLTAIVDADYAQATTLRLAVTNGQERPDPVSRVVVDQALVPSALDLHVRATNAGPGRVRLPAIGSLVLFLDELGWPLALGVLNTCGASGSVDLDVGATRAFCFSSIYQGRSSSVHAFIGFQDLP